jgi:LmbE family N-acetylglucosaminyl deacetylase
MVCTHNSWGEYGHKDHILLNKIVKEIKKEILCSDIIIQGFVNYPQFIDDQDVQNENPRLWKRCKEIYLRYKCWTWSNPKNKRPILKAKFYIDK